MSKRIEEAVSLIHTAKKWMSFFVLVLMTIIVAIAIVELGIILYLDLFDPTDDVLFLEINELFRIFGFFFIILIGFELIETVEMYFRDNIIHPTFVGRFSENFNLFCPAEGAIVQCSYLVVKVEEKVADGDCGR